MARKTLLEIVGVYGDGWQDPDTGVEYYNDRVVCDHGLLGKLKVEFEDGFPIITQADELVLIRRGFPQDWDQPTTGVEVEANPFGYSIFQLTGKNGMVRYRLLDDELAWKREEDAEESGMDDDRLSKFQLGARVYSKWFPMRQQPERYRHETITTVLQEAK